MEAKSLPADPFGLVGTLLDKKYRVERVAAAGGFGVVYAGHHLGLDRAVAIKVMRPVAEVDADAWADGVTAFLHEAKAIASIDHPAVVGVLDAGVATLEGFPGGVPWIVLEWIDGETLEAHLANRRGRGRPPAEALALLHPVFEAIASAHAVGILHRDLKPSNIMLQAPLFPALAHRVRVLDFGIAKLARDEPATTGGNTTTQSRSRAFSAACAAPEQISGTRTGPWTDIYALALLLTEVIADAPPYPLGDPTTRFAVVFDKRRPTPHSLGVDVGAWEPILERALAVHPAERHASARELLADLEGALPRALSRARRAEDIGEGAHSAAGQASEDARAATGSSVSAKTPLRADTVPRRRMAMLVAGALAMAGGGAITWWSRVRASAADSASRSTRPATPCSSNRACSEGGTPSICRRTDGQCTSLASVDCTVLADEAAKTSEDTVWIGAMFPLVGKDAEGFGFVHARAVDLARQDFAQTMSGLSASKVGDAARPFGVVSCDDATNPRRAAAHLVDDLGVQAIIGFRGGVEQIDLATTLFLAKKVLSVASTSTNPLLTRVPEPPGQPRLVWRTTYSSSGAAPAIASFISTTLKPRLRGQDARTRAAPRVAMIRPTNAVGGAFADALPNALRAEDPRSLDDGVFLDLPYDPEAADAAAPYASMVDRLVAFAPDVILFTGGSLEVQRILVPLEALWPTSAQRRPFYVSPFTLGTSFADLTSAHPDARRRVFGLSTVSNSPANARFLNRYHEVFPADHVTRTFAPDTAYDAFYLLAYASYAIPAGTPVTGPSLSLAFDRLKGPGRSVQVGLVDIFDAYRELSAGRAIDIVGASGDLDLDRATGEAEFDQSILCIATDAQGRATDGVESGLVYSASAHRLVGKMRCP
jgi:serine/threonine protein kinase